MGPILPVALDRASLPTRSRSPVSSRRTARPGARHIEELAGGVIVEHRKRNGPQRPHADVWSRSSGSRCSGYQSGMVSHLGPWDACRPGYCPCTLSTRVGDDIGGQTNFVPSRPPAGAQSLSQADADGMCGRFEVNARKRRAEPASSPTEISSSSEQGGGQWGDHDGIKMFVRLLRVGDRSLGLRRPRPRRRTARRRRRQPRRCRPVRGQPTAARATTVRGECGRWGDTTARSLRDFRIRQRFRARRGKRG